jgi:hypothetical protein
MLSGVPVFLPSQRPRSYELMGCHGLSGTLVHRHRFDLRKYAFVFSWICNPVIRVVTNEATKILSPSASLGTTSGSTAHHKPHQCFFFRSQVAWQSLNPLVDSSPPATNYLKFTPPHPALGCGRAGHAGSPWNRGRVSAPLAFFWRADERQEREARNLVQSFTFGAPGVGGGHGHARRGRPSAREFLLPRAAAA